MSKKHEDVYNFPRGEKCDECGARKYVVNEGFGYCINGHKQDGLVHFDLENQGGFGELARKSQRIGKLPKTDDEIEMSKQEQTKRLSSNKARELYLECIQLILRKQLWYLIHTHPTKFPRKIEATVKDLWELRICKFPGLTIADGEERPKVQSPSASQEEPVYYSSLGGETEEEDSQHEKHSLLNWAATRWQIPQLAETMGMIYLACVMHRLPIRPGHLHMMAKTMDLPYISMPAQLPPGMISNLPLPYIQALTREASRGNEIHNAVRRLVNGYHKHFGLLMPQPNWPLLLLEYIQQLALPIEIYLASKKLVFLILETNFAFPLGTRPPTYKSSPDALMIGSIIVATKLFFPFKNTTLSPFTKLRFDWNVWMQSMPGADKKFEGVTETDIFAMDEKRLDEYILTLRTSKQANTTEDDLLKMFPLENEVSIQQAESPFPNAEIQKMASQIYDAMSTKEPQWNSGEKYLYPKIRKAEQLIGEAKAFHERACKLSGLKMKTLLKTVEAIERKMVNWAEEQKKRAQDEF